MSRVEILSSLSKYQQCISTWGSLFGFSKVPPGFPTTTTIPKSPFKSLSVQTASLLGPFPCSHVLCSSWEKSPLCCCLDSDWKVWKSLVCAETREVQRQKRRASSEPLRTAAAWGTSGAWQGHSLGPQRGGQEPGCWSCSPLETGSSGWTGRMKEWEANPRVSR